MIINGIGTHDSVDEFNLPGIEPEEEGPEDLEPCFQTSVVCDLLLSFLGRRYFCVIGQRTSYVVRGR